MAERLRVALRKVVEALAIGLFVAFWGLILIGPIGWGILLVVGIYEVVGMRERAKDRRHREVIAAIEKSGRFPS